ncbi:hypothetical protein [Hwangdonia lutea]|uniref:Uncharacterized protein n=1 Tax=Hwangdonia lutea TaxID=3075823 RepID=A0AA97HRB6_9FLAO|nr:hypothetical protein [Hwangdonia sp. SCSIO 19198]WOD43263.1 hypothetical protein RNZ46_14830 [Hwangdonia sp. SCSIO 19198]
MITLILLALATMVTLSLGGFMPLFSIVFGWLFLYYLIIYIVLILLRKKENNILKYAMATLICIPMVWALFAPEYLFDFLLQGVKLDFR